MTEIIVQNEKVELSFTGNHISIETTDIDALDRLLQDSTVKKCLLYDSSTIYRSKRVQYAVHNGLRVLYFRRLSCIGTFRNC